MKADDAAPQRLAAARPAILLALVGLIVLALFFGGQRLQSASGAYSYASTSVGIDADPTGNSVGPPESGSTQCSNAVDDDGDGLVNDGCPMVGVVRESGAACANNTDDDGDGKVNDGCPANISLGTIESCRSINNGDTFSIDFWIKDVALPGIEALQGDLGYDQALLKVTANNVNLLLGALPGSSVQNLTPDTFPDTDGKFTPAAYDFGTQAGHTESGSGVLARITLQAIANGTSQLTLTKVKLCDPALPTCNPIGDNNGDGIFDGAISNAEVRIGQPCPTPTPTPAPFSPTVGGIAELPDMAQTPAGQSGSSEPPYAVLAGAIAAAAALAIGAGAWYARRRWAR